MLNQVLARLRRTRHRDGIGALRCLFGRLHLITSRARDVDHLLRNLQDMVTSNVSGTHLGLLGLVVLDQALEMLSLGLPVPLLCQDLLTVPVFAGQRLGIWHRKYFK